MTTTPKHARRRALSTLLASAALSSLAGMPVAAAQPFVSAGSLGYQTGDAYATDASAYGGYGLDEASAPQEQPATETWLASLEFATADDAEAFAELATNAAVSPVDPRAVARAFVREHLGIDGEDYVVAHFRNARDRSRGAPDHTVPLIDAVMEAFPEQAGYSTFATAADAIGGLNNGAHSLNIVQLGEQVAHESSARNVFVDLGAFLWSRTGPGYLYMTFFAKGNAIETAKEESRDVDEAFGLYRKGSFTSEHRSPLRLSDVVKKFKAPSAFSELPYISRLNGELDKYWREHKADWTVLARYQFVLRARAAHASGRLGDEQFELVMRGGAPRVPLAGPVTLSQLRESSRDTAVQVRRFDINGYTASNLVRFVAADGSEVMYVPGFDPSFVVADSERALRQWVLEQAMDPRSLEALLSHFSIYDSQDGVFWTGVRHGLEKIGNGQWQNDGQAIDHRNAAIAGDVFDDMRNATERRVREDARMQTRNAWETWRVTTNRSAALLSPLGFIRPLVVPVQVALAVVGTGTGIEQGVDGRTLEERKQGFEQAGMTLVSTALIGAGLGDEASDENVEESVVEPVSGLQPFMRPPQRINGQIGYLASPARAPRFPGATSRIYIDVSGRIARWTADVQAANSRAVIPKRAKPLPGSQGIYVLEDRQFVKLSQRRAVPIVPDGAGYRILMHDKTSGPWIAPKRDGTWDLAATEDNHISGSYLSNVVADQYSAHPEALHRAARVLEDFGSSEANLRDASAREAGPLVKLSVGHGILETLSARLRDPSAVTWTPREIELLLPSLTRESARPIALIWEDGTLRFGLRPDGSEFDAHTIPRNAIRLEYADGRYRLAVDPGTKAVEWPSVFRQVGRAMGESIKRRSWEGEFRTRLADAFDARSSAPELDIIHRRWIEPTDLPGGKRQALTTLSSLRHALVDRHVGLSSDQVARLRLADQTLRAELFAGEPDPRPPFNDVLARMSDLNRQRSDADMDFMMPLLTRIAEEEDALLPRGLNHLVVYQASVLGAGQVVTGDHWTVGWRHYVRLRDLDGRVQVVETGPSYAGGYRQIRAPDDGLEPTTGRYVVQRDDAWFPEQGLRNGYTLMPPVLDLQAFVSIDVRPPPALDGEDTIIERMVNSIPQPMLRLAGTSLPEAGTTAQGAVEFTIRHPTTGLPVTFPTHLDTAGNPVPRAWRAALLPETLTSSPPDSQLVMPVARSHAPHAAGNSSANYLTLLEDERPISAFVEAGFGDRHIKALVQTRRMRGFLREDGHIAVVGATPEHAFTLVMPTDAESLNFVSTGAAGSRAFASLPADTIIVDPMFGVTSTVADYPSAIRAVAERWETGNMVMKRVERDGSETHESPRTFTERLLESPVRANLWNPAGDPISETAYVMYMRRLYAMNGTLRHAGLDWLGSRAARRDYMSYFAKPFDVMPTWDAPPADNVAATTLYDLAKVAVQVIAPPGSPPVM